MSIKKLCLNHAVTCYGASFGVTNDPDHQADLVITVARKFEEYLEEDNTDEEEEDDGLPEELDMEFEANGGFLHIIDANSKKQIGTVYGETNRKTRIARILIDLYNERKIE